MFVWRQGPLFDVIIEINHAHELTDHVTKEWFLNILNMATDKGKCLVWSFHGWFGIITLDCGLVSFSVLARNCKPSGAKV